MTVFPRPRLLSPILKLLLTVGAVCLIWQAVISSMRIPAYLVPSPGQVAQAFLTEWRRLVESTGYTLTSAGLGICVSTTIAIALAALGRVNRNVDEALAPLVIVFRSMPVTAIAPIIMLAFGRSIATGVVVVTIVSFFPIFVNLKRGLAGADANAEQLFHVYDASGIQRLRMLHFPQALPFLFAGLRVAGGSAILGAMLSEWLTGLRGLGNLILESGEMREISLLWAAVITSVFFGLSVFWATSAGERRVLHWKQRSSAQPD